ncbi:MAG: hypothetical protein WDM96_08890 [Lacunisphaera sp.]
MAHRPKPSPLASAEAARAKKPAFPAGISPGESAAGSRRARWLGLTLLGLLLLAYYPAMSGGFIWDDDAHLTANPCVVGPLGLKDIWTTAHMRICPLVQTTFWLEYRIWGLNPLPYHLVNIVLHALSALVLWRVLRLLRVPGAWLGAALWALHPVQVESVAWITELKNTQSGLFFLLAVWCFGRSRQAETAPGPKGRFGIYYGLTLIFAVLAMASKSSTVVLPLVLGLVAWWLDRAWHWRRNLLQLTPLLLLSILTGLVTMWTQRTEGAFDPEFALGWGGRLAVAGRVVWFYAGKLFWPHPLIFVYPRWRIEAADFVTYLPTLALAGLLIALWWQRDRWARTLFFHARLLCCGPAAGARPDRHLLLAVFIRGRSLSISGQHGPARTARSRAAHRSGCPAKVPALAAAGSGRPAAVDAGFPDLAPVCAISERRGSLDRHAS